jgi:YHS domain-containing protein
MNLIRRTAWAVVMLGAVAGCSGGEETSTTPGGPAANPGAGGAGRPSNPPAKIEPSKEAPSKEMLPPPSPPAEPKKAEDAKKEGPALEGPKSEGKAETKKDTAATKTLTPDEIATIKQLPEADQGPALAQAICPVSGEHLGSMDKPYKTSAEGRTFFLCCENCQKEVKSNPKAVIAKLEAAAKK